MTRSAVVLGASVSGAVSALLLARTGWEVTVVDPELQAFARPDGRPGVRAGAPQAVHAHGFGSRVHVELSRRLPDVWAALLAAGAHTVPFEQMAPPALYDGGRPGDEDVLALQCRRYTFDRVLGEALLASDATLEPVRGRALLLDPGAALPTVRGLALQDGRELRCDVLIDAAGRRSPVTGWLRGVGVDPPERHDESIARYYSRHYRIRGDRAPLNAGFADVQPFTCHVQLLFLGDADTAMVAMAAHDEDPVLKALRHPDAFEAVVAANDAFAAWRAVLEPDSEVFCLGAFDNRARSLVADGRPIVLGVHQVGDALAMTNPTRGRGVAMALMAAGALVDRLLEHADDESRALAMDQWRERVLMPAYRECARTDEIAAQQMRAGLAGRSLPLNAPQVELPEGHPISYADLERAADHDPDLFRVLERAAVLLDDERYVASPEVADRVRRTLEEHPATPSAPRTPPTGGLHDRAELERLLAAYA